MILRKDGDLTSWLLGPDGSPKRLGTARHLARPQPRSESETDENLKLSLRALRAECTRSHRELLMATARTLEIATGEPPFEAATAEQAAQWLADRIGKTTHVTVNRSAAVAEILPHLHANGIKPVETYDDQYEAPKVSASRYWEIENPTPEAAWQAFGRLTAAPSPEPEMNYAAVLGVNVMSACSGSPFFVQHLHNISEMLTRASDLYLVLPINKIAADDNDARFIARAIGRFGSATVALTAGRRGGGRTLPHAARAGHQRIHVVLLDNGRSALLGTAFERLLDCIGCRACALECPTHPYFGGNHGWTPRDYLAAALRSETKDMGLCTGCRRCGELCPIGIELPAMIAQAKARRSVSLANYPFTHMQFTLWAGGTTAPLSNVALATPALRWPAEKLMGVDRRRKMPKFSRQRLSTVAPADSPTVVYYYGCYVQYTDPDLGHATISILRHNGFAVSLPPLVCCGAAAYAYGDRAAARSQAKKTIDALYPLAAQGLPILVTCPSCGLALKRDIPELLGSTPEVSLVAQQTKEAVEFLLDLAENGKLASDLSPVLLTLGYHTPCHLRVRDGGDAAPKLLNMIPGLNTKAIDRGCCGLSGSFGFKKKNFGYSMEIGDGLFDALRQDGIQQGVTDCAGCELQMKQGSGLPVRHPLKYLFDSYRLSAIN